MRSGAIKKYFSDKAAVTNALAFCLPWIDWCSAFVVMTKDKLFASSHFPHHSKPPKMPWSHWPPTIQINNIFRIFIFLFQATPLLSHDQCLWWCASSYARSTNSGSYKWCVKLTFGEGRLTTNGLHPQNWSEILIHGGILRFLIGRIDLPLKKKPDMETANTSDKYLHRFWLEIAHLSIKQIPRLLLAETLYQDLNLAGGQEERGTYPIESWWILWMTPTFAKYEKQQILCNDNTTQPLEPDPKRSQLFYGRAGLRLHCPGRGRWGHLRTQPTVHWGWCRPREGEVLVLGLC